MRIRRIVLKNYRQFRNNEINFGGKAENDLTILIGVMGTGKTNILNAINWCLFGEEPFLSRNSEQLTRLNLNSIQQAPYDGKTEEVRVEIWAEHNGMPFTFVRDELYSCFIYKDGHRDCRMREKAFEVRLKDDKGNDEIVKSEEADSLVERFVPSGIKEYFLFDGERLDNYFKVASGQKIYKEIFQMAQVNVLDEVENNLRKTLSDLEREAGRHNPQIESTRAEIEKKEERKVSLVKEVNEYENQNRVAKQEIEELSKKLSGIPDIGLIQRQMNDLKIRKSEKDISLKQKVKIKQDLIFESLKYFMFLKTVKAFQDIIGIMLKSGKIPPKIDRQLLNRILNTKKCICSREIKKGGVEEQHILNLLEEMETSTEIAKKLHAMEVPLDRIISKASQFDVNNRAVSKDIETIEKEILQLDKGIKDFEAKILGYPNVEDIKNWYKQKKNYEDQLETNLEKLGSTRIRIRAFEKDIADSKAQLKEEMDKEGKVKDLKNIIEFNSQAVNIVTEAKSSILDRIRKQIEKDTTATLLDLMWKKDTYKRVNIDDNYNFHVVHSYGYDSLGSMSGGERECLALSFTIALHRVSGFDAPIIIDRPLAAVSGDPVKFIAEAFLKISLDKQVILFCTPNDYSGDFQNAVTSKVNSQIAFFGVNRPG